MTQSELAKPEFTKAFVSHLENGRTLTSLRAAGILAQRLGVPVTTLLSQPAPRAEALVDLRLLQAERELGSGRPGVALELVRSIRPTRDELRARSRRVEGRALLQLGRADEAVRPLKDAVGILRAATNRELGTRALFDLAYAHASLDQPAEALRMVLEVERALTGRDLVDRTLELEVQSLLAGFYMRLGDVASADRHAAEATTIAQDVVDPTALATLYATALSIREEQGDLEGALVYARKAVELQESIGREVAAAVAWNNLAWVYVQRRQFEKAETALTSGERIATARSDDRLTAVLQLTRAELELARGHHARAAQLASAAASGKGRQALRAAATLIVAQAAAAGRAPLRKTLALFEQAIDAHDGQPPRQIARVHEIYGDVLAKAGRAKEAYEHARKARALNRRPALA